MKKETKKGSRCPKCDKGYLFDKICVEDYHDLFFQCTYCDYTVSDLDLEADKLMSLYLKLVMFIIGLIMLGFSGICYLLDECWSLQGVILICLAAISLSIGFFTKIK
jgi:uncharacterized protein (DUF983 family)